MAESRLGRTYRIIYDKLCGRRPNLCPWHFQWLDTYYLYRSLKRSLPTFGGQVLDAGCGSGPYHEWFGPVTKYVGLDVSAGRGVVASNKRCRRYPMKTSVSFFSQVLEHLEHPDITLKEVSRALAILTLPFLYNETRGAVALSALHRIPSPTNSFRTARCYISRNTAVLGAPQSFFS